jgi:MGT family glycosyltransferase
MARYLFCPAPYIGETYPTVPVALALRALGHEVAYLTSPAIARELAAEGLRSFTSPAGVYGEEMPSGDETAPALFAALPAQVAVLGRALDDFRAGVVVDGTFPFAPRLCAELRGIPHASIAAGAVPIPTEDPLFPHGPGTPPPTDELGRSLARLARIVEQERRRSDVDAWDAARERLDLPADGTHPCRAAASRSLVLLATSAAFEYRRSDLPPQYWFVGPLVWQTGLAEVPPRVAALRREETVVFVSHCSFFNREARIPKLAIEALRGEPVRVLATVIRDFDPGEFGPLPPNVILERFVPLSRILDKLSLLVSHGGAGAVHAALSRGIPMVLLPLGADHFEVAARATWAGAAVTLHPRTCTPAELRAAIHAVLHDARYRESAQRIAASYSRFDGPDQAASLLERLAESGGPVTRPPGDDPWAEPRTSARLPA